MSGDVLARLLDADPLAPADMRRTFDLLVATATPEAVRTALLTAVSARRESADELVLAAREMRRRAVAFPVPVRDHPIDLCGTGGAPRPSFNVSTVSAFVVAAAGAAVVKHGNRSARGVCGSSDLLEALGLPVTSSRTFASASYAAERIAFLHAPLYHPATAAVREARRILEIPTIFNRLGPLSSPAGVRQQVVGTSSTALARLYAEALPRLGVRRGVAMSSAEGCDEFSPRHVTTVRSWGSGRVTARTVRPSALLEPSEQRGDWGPLAPAEAAAEAARILRGGAGARRGAVLLTSGAALAVHKSASGLSDGVRQARRVLDEGTAFALLGRLRSLAHGHGRASR